VLEFWFEFASTYSYVAASRLRAVAEAAGVAVRYQPFLLGPIFADQGWNDSPFNLQPIKGRYMWRDMERLCEARGLPFQRPTTFPRNGLLAARVCCVGYDELWLPQFVDAVYAANFGQDRDIADPELLVRILDTLDAPGAEILEATRSDEVKQRLRAQTDQARAHGIFGAPSFVVGSELFWGQDRLGDAVAMARLGS
jgi:2-hydroxychromene-2-carboxylate isomerase